MMMKKSLLLLGSFCLAVVAGCGAKEAKEACEDFADALEECDPALALVGDAIAGDCDEAEKDDLEVFECARDWAEDGCTGIMDC